MGEAGVRIPIGVVAGLALSLAACSSSPKPAPATAAPARTAPAPSLPPAPPPQAAAPAPPPAEPVPQTPVPPAAPVAGDLCGASVLQDLVGKPRTDIPVPADLSHRRVYCTTCMVTQDYDPARLNILFDAQTGLVTQVRCG
jgi:hypothetical protein